MQEIVLTKGIPASGKSTWSEKMVSQSDNWKRVNKDLLRLMLDNSKWSQPNEKFILDIRDHIVREAIRKHKNVIVDDTNFEDKHFERMCQIAASFNRVITVREMYFPIDLEEALRRDKNRQKAVGEAVIKRYYNKYIDGRTVKERCETFVPREVISSHTFNLLPKAIICDLDGTAALLNGRDPYNATNCDMDKLNIPVFHVVEGMYNRGAEILFVSGREDKYKEPTERFLKKHFCTYEENVICEQTEFSQRITLPELKYMPYKLYMRKTGDMRKDTVIKREIYEEHIRDKYNILFVLDDRPSVVRMWRYDLGLTVFQLNDQEF